MTRRLLQLLSDTALYSSAGILRRGLSIVTLPILTRWLTMQQFGVLAVIGTVRDLLAVIFQFGLPNAADRFYFDCRTELERRRLLGTLFLFQMPLSLAASLLLIWAGPAFWTRLVPDIPFHPYVSLTVATVFLSGMGILPRSLFRVTNRVPLFVGLSTVHGVLTATLSIAFVVVWELGVLGPVLGQLAAVAVFFVVFFTYLRKHLAWEFSPDLAQRALGFGLPDIPVRVGRWGLKLADRLILQRFVPLSVVGLYSLGYSLGSLPFELIASSTSVAILPFFYRLATEEPEHTSKPIFAVVAAYDAALLAFLGLGTILFAREIILLFATPQYLGAEAVVPFVVWASMLQTLSHIPLRSIYLTKRTAGLPFVFLMPALLNLGLNLILIPRYGMMGAAWATLLAYPAMLGLTLWLAQRVYHIPYDYWRIAKPLLIALGISLLKDTIPTESMLLALALKVLLLATFPALLLVSGFVTPEERRALGRLVYRPLFTPAASHVRK